MTIKEALRELKIAERMNPGPWIDHSLNTGTAARIITKKAGEYDPEKAYIYAILHDIGRRNGFSHIKHTLDGYNYLYDKDLKAASICLSHSFPNKNIYEYQGKFDISEFETEKIKAFLEDYPYDYYDQLIQLCDSVASATGFVKMEVRWVDVAIRNGINDFVVQKRKKIMEIQASFNEAYNINIDSLLGI